jgi:hypothetical protein
MDWDTARCPSAIRAYANFVSGQEPQPQGELNRYAASQKPDFLLIDLLLVSQFANPITLAVGHEVSTTTR